MANSTSALSHFCDSPVHLTTMDAHCLPYFTLIINKQHGDSTGCEIVHLYELLCSPF